VAEGATQRLDAWVVALATFVTVLIGISRIYLGVHYPTDVLDDWAVGEVWATCCWLPAGYPQRRGAIETLTDGTIRTSASHEVESKSETFCIDAPG